MSSAPAPPQKVTPFLMFDGQAADAMAAYTELFEDAQILETTRYGPDEAGAEGTIRHARFSLSGQQVICIDIPVPHEFGFTPAFSLFVECAEETELDRLYTALSHGGRELMPLDDYGLGAKFGWLNDRFGVSWQLSLPA